MRAEHIANICWVSDLYLTGEKLPEKYVVVVGPESLYGDDELALLSAFTTEYHERHIAFFGPKLDWRTNFISFEKEIDRRDPNRVRWLRKRYSWRSGFGGFYASSLPEAMAVFWRNRTAKKEIGTHLLLDTGRLAVVAGRPTDDVKSPDYMRFSVRDLETGDVSIVDEENAVMVAQTIEQLGRQMRMAHCHRGANYHDAGISDLEAWYGNFSSGDDPAALARMWENRLRSWKELEQLDRAAA